MAIKGFVSAQTKETMKNKRIESTIARMKSRAKQFCNSNCYRTKQKLYSDRLFESSNSKPKQWDDFSFRIGQRVYSIAWISPSMLYEEECESVAFEQVGTPAPKQPETAIPVHRAVGKSRKKIVAYQSNILSGYDPDYFDRVHAVAEEIKIHGDVSISPYLKTRFGYSSVLVDCCFEYQWATLDELESLKNILILLLTGKETLDTIGKSNLFSKCDWIARKTDNF